MLYIVRHGQTNWNKLKKHQGQADIPLNETGIYEAGIVKEKLKNIKFDVVYSSPLSRALKTASIITNEKITIDDRIIERGNGDLEGMHVDEIIKIINYRDEKCIEKYNIEPTKNLLNRVFNFLDEIKEKYADKNILVVTHAGTSIYMRIYFEGFPKNDDYDSYKLNNCEFITYDLRKED